MPLLVEESNEKKQKKISNIISKLAHTDKKIENTSKSLKYPVWRLLNEESSNKGKSSNKTND